MLERITVVLPLRIKYRHRIGQLIIGHMMVTDNEIYAQALGISNLLDCLYSTIKDYD